MLIIEEEFRIQQSFSGGKVKRQSLKENLPPTLFSEADFTFI